MRWPAWWHIVVALRAAALAQPASPTVCEDDACRCDSFTRVICSCTADADTVTLRPDGAFRVPAMATAIMVEGCERVQFLSDTVRHLGRLQLVDVRNSRHVLINNRALNRPPLGNNPDLENNPGIRIVIHNSTIDIIGSYAIQGRVDSIVISDSRINFIEPYAFSSLIGVTNVELSNNHFVGLATQIFKKFTTSNFVLRGGVIHTLPSRFLSDVEVTSLFRMEGVLVEYMFSSAFRVTLPERVLIESNTIGVMDGDCFHIASRGPITFRNNTITGVRKGAFLGFSALPEVTSVKGQQELLLDNNIMTELMPSSLVYDTRTLTMRVDGLNLNTTCSCELADEWRDVLHDQGGAGGLSCWYSLEGYFVSLPTFVDSRCGKFKQHFWIYVAVGVIVILIIAALGVYFIVKRENEKKKKVQIVMPDGKTYRETEFHIVVERADLLTTDL
uniref:Right handed beta helix domain-containing protein n=1 Tax=Pectinophora gossypiella TaxID=13191 RepID=A0A1E1WMQ9_PECGO